MFESMKRGMRNTRERFTERMNIILDRGPDVDEEFWEGLEEALILSDVGAQASYDIVERMRDQARRKALPDAYAVMDALAESIADTFATSSVNVFDENPVLVLFVGINGAGKTTTVGKIAYEATSAGRTVLLGSADTFRAAAIEQLEEWARRANVDIVQRERGSDPASVCYDTIERAEAAGSDLVLIDTAGRLHTSDDLMRELQKVVNVVRKRSKIPVRTVLVIDATTGQNGLSQARQFHQALDLDAIIVTKLDGTAKGGIALAVSHELGLPIAKVGVGESLEDLQDFDALDFAASLIGAEPEDSDVLPNVGNADAAVQAGGAEGLAFGTLRVPSTLGAESGSSASAGLDLADSSIAGEPSFLAEPESPADFSGSEEESEEERAFSWKDDFGRPDTMIESLGAQTSLEVVSEDAPGHSERSEESPQAQVGGLAEAENPEDGLADSATSEAEDVADQEAEPEEAPKEGRFKRMFKWMGRNRD